MHIEEELPLLTAKSQRDDYDSNISKSRQTELERASNCADYDPSRKETDFSGQHKENDTKKSVWGATDWRQKAIILYIAMVNYINYLCNSAASPFLARVVLQKGGTVVLSTIVLQVSMITMTIFCVVVAKYQSRIGCKMLIVFGQVIFSISQILFGFIEYFQSQWMLVVAGTLLRAIQGTCQAALGVAGLTIVCQEFPDFVATVFGIFEAAYGAGYLSGPYLGGYLYDLSGGMVLPMVSTGVLMLIYAALGLIVLKRLDKCTDTTGKSNLGLVLTKPKAIIIIGAAGTIVGGFALADATITIYLKSLHFSATRVGQILFLMGAMYCVFALICGGFVNHRKVIRRCFIVTGILGCLTFPLAFTPNQVDAWIYIAVVGYGISGAISFVPGFNELLDVMHADEDNSDPSDMSLISAVSGLWSASVSLFSFILPLIGSFVELSLPFSISFVSSLLACFGATLGLGTIVFLRQQLVQDRGGLRRIIQDGNGVRSVGQKDPFACNT